MSNVEIDALLREPAIVHGSLPPDNRDLDLLLGADERRRVAGELSARGWSARRGTWATFADGTAFAVDLVVLEDWAPSPAVATALREQALPLEGFTHLRAPAPHHRLLMLARRHRSGMALTDRRRAWLDQVPADVWVRAADDAPAWNAVDALEGLRSALRGNAPQRGSVWRVLRNARRRRPAVIALSGLDGSGKSTHAEHLERALGALGHDATVQWSKIARDPVLDAIARPVKRLLGRGRAPSIADGELGVDDACERRQHPDGPRPPRSAASRRREQSALLTWGWSVVVAAANAATQRRMVGSQHSSVVICDRYVLDSIVHLRHRYPTARRFALQRSIIELLSPRPAAAFLLDVPPSVARARKPEQYTTADLAVLQRLYREEAARLGVTVVDVDRETVDVAADIARATWLALGR